MLRLLAVFASLSLVTFFAHATELADEDDVSASVAAEPTAEPVTELSPEARGNILEALSLLGAEVQGHRQL